MWGKSTPHAQVSTVNTIHVGKVNTTRSGGEDQATGPGEIRTLQRVSTDRDCDGDDGIVM